MRKVIRTVMTAIGLSACLIVLVACSQEGELSEASGGELMLRVGLSLSARSSDLEPGVENENKIDVKNKDYRIYFFDTENKFIAEFTPDDVTQASDKSHEYSVTGKAPAGLATYTDFKMVVLANWGTAYPKDLKKGTTTIEDICTATTATFDFFSPEDLINGKKLIPFYGVREYKDVKFKPNEYVNLTESVELLRAVAKVEVLLESELPDLTIEEVKIHRYHSKGYCAPKEEYSETNNNPLHLIENGKVEDTADFSKNNPNNKWIIYLPEYDNQQADDDNYSYITVKFAHQTSDEAPHSIYFAKYTDGKTENTNRMNIQRNHLYRFTVKATPLNFQVSVDKWKFGGKVHIEM